MNIQEFKFKITIQAIGKNLSEENEFVNVVHAHSTSGAWLKCVSEVNNDLQRYESLYKIELMEVND